MRINNNLMAMNTHRQLGLGNAAGAKSMEKLSSGYRINRAGDDAAGLAISEKMRGQIRGLTQASRNAQDGISLIQTAEGALNETHAILQRMRELSVQASNDTMTDEDRDALQEEITQLTSEIDRIGNNTEFNTKKLLNGSVSDQSTVAAASGITYGDGMEKLNLDSASELAAGSYTLKTVTDTKVLNGLSDASHTVGVTGVEIAADTALAEGQYLINVTSDITANTTLDQTDSGLGGAITASNLDAQETGLADGDYAFEFDAPGTSVKITYTAADGGSETVTVSGLDTSGTASYTASFLSEFTGDLTFTLDGTKIADGNVFSVSRSTQYKAELLDADGDAVDADGSPINISAGEQGVVLGDPANEGGVTVNFDTNLVVGEAAFSIKATGQASAILINGDDEVVAQKLISDNTARIDLGDTGLSFSTTAIENDAETTFSINTSTVDNALKFQIGSNKGQEMELGISDMRATKLGVDGVDVSSQSGAKNAIETLDSAIAKVSEERSKLGAVQNRLEHSIKNLDTSSENLQAAESRIRDVDYATAA